MLTAGLDAGSSTEVVRLLAACDAQLFSGYAGLPTLYSDEVVASAVAAVRCVAAALCHPRGRVVIGGCGTSGRLAHLLARDINLSAGAGGGAGAGTRSPFGYLLAGGDGALLVPQEAVEDSPHAGRDDLACWCAARSVAHDDPLVVIGVSCGLSATYVASLLAAGLDRGPATIPIAVGFNPVDAVRLVHVPGTGELSFHAVLGALLLSQSGATAAEVTILSRSGGAVSYSPPTRGLVLNPVVGPEAVAGSSRMKGGSATLLLLAPICQLGLALSSAVGSNAGSNGQPRLSAVTDRPPARGLSDDRPSLSALTDRQLAALLRGGYAQMEAGVRQLYATATPELAALVDVGALSLTTPILPRPHGAASEGAPTGTTSIPTPTGYGRICYVGSGHAGLLGLVDASEATDTYGSQFNEVRAFTVGGWPAMDVCSLVDGVGVDPAIPPELRRGVKTHGVAPPLRVSETANPSLDSFLTDFVPTLTAADTVILLHLGEAGAGRALHPQVAAAAVAAKAAGADVRHVMIVESDATADCSGGSGDSGGRDGVAAALSLSLCSNGGITIPLPSLALQWRTASALPPISGVEAAAVCGTLPPSSPSSVGSLVLKLALNAITTGAHVARGAVIGNVMANMMLTNHKLYLRAVGIVGEVGGVGAAAARHALLRSIYSTDDDSAVAAMAAAEAAEGVAAEGGGGGVVAAHIVRASVTDYVIPIALLLLLEGREEGERGFNSVGDGDRRGGGGGMSVAAARALLAAQPAVRKAIAAARRGGDRG